jgi:hypothetical protein
MELTMVIDHVLNIQHNLGVSPMSLCGHLGNATAPCLEDTSRLRIEHKRNRQQSLDPFCEASAVKPQP